MRRAEQDEATTDVLTVQAIDGGFCVVRVGQECKAVACDFSILPFDDDVVRCDLDISILEELDDLIWSHLPWQASHLDSSGAVAVVEFVSELDILELGPDKIERKLEPNMN